MLQFKRSMTVEIQKTLRETFGNISKTGISFIDEFGEKPMDSDPNYDIPRKKRKKQFHRNFKINLSKKSCSFSEKFKLEDLNIKTGK